MQRGNFDLAIHSLTSSIDPGDYYFKYHSSQFEPDGQNDARVDNVGIDVALETVTGSVHLAVIRDAMIEFQEIFVEQVVEIPLYFSETVELHSPKVGNVRRRLTRGGLHVECRGLVRQGLTLFDGRRSRGAAPARNEPFARSARIV